MEKYKKYEEVPWFRKNGINSAMVFLGLAIPPLIWLVAFNLITGEVYQNNYDNKGNLKTWSKVNKVVAWIILIVQVIIFYKAFTFA